MSDSTANPPPDGEGTRPPPPPPPQPPQGPGYGTPPPAYGTPPPGYGPVPPGVGQPADLLTRFLARLIDFILIGLVNGLISAVLLVSALGMNNGFGGYGLGDRDYTTDAITGLVGAAISLAYFALMESRTGQTVGKMALKLRTVGPHGGPPSLEVAVRRNFWVALGALAVVPVIGNTVGGLVQLVVVIVIAVTIGQSPVRQGWHDRFAGGTAVLRTG